MCTHFIFVSTTPSVCLSFQAELVSFKKKIRVIEILNKASLSVTSRVRSNRSCLFDYVYSQGKATANVVESGVGNLAASRFKFNESSVVNQKLHLLVNSE